MADREDKVQAFKLFDFDKNEEYKAHMRNVELPPSATKAQLVKAKAKWYKRVVDPDFELEWLPDLSASQPSGASTAPPASQPPPQQQQQQQQQQQRPPAAAAGGRARGSPQWKQGRRLNLALLQALILVLTLLYMQPLSRGLSYWAYSKLMVVLVASQALKIHTTHGLPAAFNLAAIQQWLRPVVMSSDGQYFMLALAALSSKPVTAVLPPFVVLAAYQLMHFLAEVAGQHPLWQQHGVHIYRAMQAKQQAALAFNAQSEIMLGFMLVAMLLFPSRTPLLCFLTWQFLRLRFWSTDGALYHRQVWAALDQMTVHFRQQFPLLQKVVDFGVHQFHQVPGR